MNNMEDWLPSVLVLKLWLVLVTAIITVTNSKVAAAYDEHAKGKLEADPSGFINIDCGANESYTDIETGLVYESDAKYIDTGENQEISSNLIFADIYKQPRQTLRSFPQGIRNCYTLKPKQGGNNRYLIRAIFEYGNYDNKIQIPKFKLHLGVNEWEIVGDDEVSMYEIIYVPSTAYIDVCLVNIGKGVPYISVLELRPLDNSIYQILNGALKGMHRWDVGGHNGVIRYLDDVYDRLWFPVNFTKGSEVSTNSTIYNQSIDAAYKVPEQVLKTAVSPSLDESLPWSVLVPLPYSGSQYYVYFHFAELEKLKDGQKGELRIDLYDDPHGEPRVSDVVTLEYLKPVTKALNYSPINSDVLIFSINAVDGYDIHPILNAFEVYELLELPFSPTNLDDVNAMNDIKRIYKVTGNWQGDPCIPSDLSWIGLQCSNNTTPRITSLNLSSSNLTGEIPIALSNLKAITFLDLSCNNLVGQVPEFLAQLPNLKILNLTGNKLTGSIPHDLLKKSKDGTLLLSVKENPGLCLSASCHKQKKFLIPILASVIGVLLILLAFIILVQHRRKRNREMASGYMERSLKSRNQPFMYSEIISITDNFKNIIGEGDFGKVYRGTLKDKTEVAVKVLSPSSRQGYKEFRAEAERLMTVYHKNLVSLIGYCDDQENKVLIYEYMTKGNLRQHLSGTGTNVLSWIDRLRIATDAAHGLDYLHNGCKPPVIHRDLKLSNILLNEKMQAKIADFGLYTFGYLNPEINAGGISNKKSDIYSFGIILLELITGQLARKGGSGSNKNILHWVTPEIERGNIQKIVDPRLQGEFNTNAAWKIVQIAMSCVRPAAFQAPDINNVLIELKECLAIEVASRRNGNRESSNTSTSYLLQESYLNGGSMEMVSSTR